jgi:Osmosensitive K+ channel histidine kinase
METRQIRVLLVEDDQDAYCLMRDLLANIRGYRFYLDWVASYEVGLERIERNQHDVYLLDYRLGQHSGLELLREMVAKGCKAPIILLTGQGDWEVEVEAMKAGAADYLVKGLFDCSLLERSIRYAIERSRDREALHQLTNDLEQRVQERMLDLKKANEALHAELAERKEFEKERQKFVSLVENSSELIGMYSLEGKTLFLNRAGRELVGLNSFSQVLSTAIADYYMETTWMILRDIALPEALATGHWKGEGQLRHFKTREPIDVAMTISTVSHPETGEILCLATIQRDIQLQKRLEESLRQQAEQLFGVNCHKDKFLAVLSHELRNPLAPIHSALALLKLQQGQADPNRGQWAIEVIDRQLTHLTRMVDDLLDVAEITHSRIQLHKEPVLLGQLITRSVETARSFIDAHRHRLILSLPAQAVQLEADPVRLAQVIANLLHNAAKFTEEGGQIWLSAQLEGNEIIIKVRDTGIGISPEILPHIFEPFFRVDQSLTWARSGLGLGLALVHDLVEMHGGSVFATSNGFRQGSEFTVRLPVLRQAEPNEDTHPHGAERGKRCILVVDDYPDVAQSFSMLLKALGHEVRTAYDGATALELAATFRPEVVFLDIGLPDMNGYEVARRLRQEPRHPPMRLIAMTGYGSQEDQRCAREAGFNHHVLKPVSIEVVEQLLTLPPPESP